MRILLTFNFTFYFILYCTLTQSLEQVISSADCSTMGEGVHIFEPDAAAGVRATLTGRGGSGCQVEVSWTSSTR